ncbi:MAG TPA: oligosaccharide flippase family protein [Candidatus Binataceae bacterium]|nr:oligosaccharide flippase family protein [Candidatus Binataceae bacterium]
MNAGAQGLKNGAPISPAPPSGLGATGLTRNVAATYANWAVNFLSPLVLIPLFVRLLGHELYGQWLIILSIASYLGLANLGSWQAIGNRIAESVAQRRHDRVATIVSTGFFAYTAIIAALMTGVLALTPVAWRHFLPHSSAQAVIAFAVFISLSAAAFPFNAYSIMLRGFERVDLEQTILFGANLARVLLIGAALLAGLKLAAIALIQGAALLAAGAASYVAAVRLTPAARPRLSQFSRAMLGELVRPSIGFFGLTVASTLAFGIDNLVIGYWIGAAGVTRYAVPFRLAMAACAAFSIGLSSLWPTVTAYYARQQHDVLRAAFIAVMRVALLFAGAAAILLWLAGPAFIRSWAGEGVFPGRVVFGLQILLMMIQVLVTPADAVLMATTRHYLYAVVAAFEGLLNLALSVWWVRYWGLSGVIGGTVAARLMTNGWYLPMAAIDTLGVAPRECLRTIAPAAALTVAMVAGALLITRDGATLAGARGAAIAAVFAVAFLAAFAVVGFTSEERKMVRAWLAAHRTQPTA